MMFLARACHGVSKPFRTDIVQHWVNHWDGSVSPDDTSSEDGAEEESLVGKPGRSSRRSVPEPPDKTGAFKWKSMLLTLCGLRPTNFLTANLVAPLLRRLVLEILVLTSSPKSRAELLPNVAAGSIVAQIATLLSVAVTVVLLTLLVMPLLIGKTAAPWLLNETVGGKTALKAFALLLWLALVVTMDWLVDGKMDTALGLKAKQPAQREQLPRHPQGT